MPRNPEEPFGGGERKVEQPEEVAPERPESHRDVLKHEKISTGESESNTEVALERAYGSHKEKDRPRFDYSQPPVDRPLRRSELPPIMRAATPFASRDRMDVLTTNARHILGAEAADDQVRELTARTLAEYIPASRLAFKSGKELLELTDVQDKAKLDDTIKQLGKAIIVTYHSHYFPHGMKMVRELLPEGSRGTVLVEKNPAWQVTDALRKIRKPFEAIGKLFQPGKEKESPSATFDMMAKRANDPRTIRSVVRRLKEGSPEHPEALFMASDRGDLSPDGKRAKVDFFDSTVNFPTGPATIARWTGAPIIPTYVIRNGERLEIRVGDPIVTDPNAVDPDAELQRVTQEIADVFEEGIQEFPEQWPVYRHDYWPEQEEYT